MAFDQQRYIDNYNKHNYKMYQFRVKKTDMEIITKLDSITNKNLYILSLIRKDISNNIYNIKQIKTIIVPILSKYNINNICLFGSYARGEATNTSDIDIYCSKGTIKTLIDQINLIDELETALGKKVDIIFDTTIIKDDFKNNIMNDLIKLK